MPAYISGYQGNFNPALAATIANGQQISSTIKLGGFSLVGVFLPAAFTGTALTFLASHDGTNFFSVVTSTSGTALSYTVAQGTYAAIDPKDFQGIEYLQIKSGSSEAAARTLTLAVKG
jgi:hypothetical protein